MFEFNRILTAEEGKQGAAQYRLEPMSYIKTVCRAVHHDILQLFGRTAFGPLQRSPVRCTLR